MDEPSHQRRWSRAIFTRALLLGIAFGGIATAGSSLVLGGTGGGAVSRAVVLATAFVAATVGLWAGAPEAAGEEVRISERWLTAAALAAVGGSFATFRTLYEQVYPGAWWGALALLLVLAIPIYAAALIPPVLLSWGEQGLEEGGEGEGWGALGPLVLGIPAGIAVGVLLAGIAVAPLWSPAVLMMSCALLLVLPMAFPGPPLGEVQENTIYRTTSAFGELRVTEVVYPGERQPERRLYLNGEEESSELVRSGAPTLAYVATAENWLSTITPVGSRYLFLGGGAYTLPRRIAERDARAKIVVVELDPEVSRIAHLFFGLKAAHGITSVHGDARAYVERGAATPFDRIYVDVYGGNERLPHSLLTIEALEGMKRCLTDGGVLAANVIGVGRGEEEAQLWSIVKTFATVFPNVVLYSHLGRDFPERQNFLLGASDDTDRSFPEQAGRFELWPRDEWPELGTATIFRDLHTSIEGAPPQRVAPPSVPRPRGRISQPSE